MIYLGCEKSGGAGGGRTLVQTGDICAFYMLIPAFIVGSSQDPDHQATP